MEIFSRNMIDFSVTDTIDGGGGGSIIYDANRDISTVPTFGAPNIFQTNEIRTIDPVTGTPINIISNNPSQIELPSTDLQNFGTPLDNINYFVYIKSNVSSANIVIDGENTFKVTPDVINIDVNSILKNPNGFKTITLTKDGFKSREKYVFSLIQNPSFRNYLENTNIDIGIGSSLIGFGNYYDLRRIAEPFRNVYSNEKFYRIKIEYYIDDVIQSFPYSVNDQNQNITFELVKTNPIETQLPIQQIPISLDGPNDSVEIVKNLTETISLKTGLNTIQFFAGDSIIIQSSNVTSFRVTNIDIASTTTRIAPLEAAQNESLKTTLTLDGDYIIDIVSTEVESGGDLILPVIALANVEARNYNINSNSGVPIYIEIVRAVNAVTAYVGEKKYQYEIGTDEKTALILIPAGAFENIGNYKIILEPSNQNGVGESKDVVVHVTDEFYVGVPDLRNITYPSIIRGADNVGTNVNFDIEWESVSTDYVRIFNGDGGLYTQVNKVGKVSLNFQQLLSLSTENVSTLENVDKNQKIISLTLKLIPYNTSGAEVVEGKAEIIEIKLETGKTVLERELVINRILEGFTSQFDDVVFEDETSKYLTHLLHLGNGDNKVITTWTGSLDSLIVKLYEPIPTSIQPNQQVWISKIQSNPIIETITIVGKEVEYCPPLKGPNFNLIPDNGIGFKVFDELVASGSQTSNDLVLRYAQSKNIDTTQLNIQYTSGSVYAFENFAHFSSAEERVKNFFYKVQLLETYEAKVTELSSGNSWTSSIDVINETKRVQQKVAEVKRGFDGFENFLYNDVSSSLAYPKVNGILLASNNPTVENWYDDIIDVSSTYDKFNPNYLVNNLPEHIREDFNNEDFILFLDMIGQHFDVIWSYINGINKTKLVENKKFDGIANNMVYHLLQSLGWEGKRAFDSQFLWEYVFGSFKDGSKKYNVSLEEANNEVWRRILNNLPYLLKHKGTGRAMKAIMACYGVPQSMLTIMEFGGPQDPTKGGSTKFTFDDRTAALQLKSGSQIVVPWKEMPGTLNYPEAVEFRIKPDVIQDTTIVKFGEIQLLINKKTGSFVNLELDLGSTITAQPYFASTGPNTPVVNPVTGSPFNYSYTSSYSPVVISSGFYTGLDGDYVLPPSTFTQSFEFPLSTEYYSNILLNRNPYGDSGSLYEILLGTSDGQRIITYVSMSIYSSKLPWDTGSLLTVGNNFSGALDEFRLWRVPLQPSKFQNHILHPDAINGNSYTASTEDLLFRLDFEYPKDRTADSYIKNVAINEIYGEVFASASNMFSASVYPYQYIPYDRTVTATVPSLGFNYSNKIRFESASLVSDLSYKTRATKKSFDRAPIDSSRLGLFFSPIKELNMDIVKAFGDFNIDNYIGDPADEYKDRYKQLDDLREYYFERLDRNIYEYIQLVKYIDKSLFDVLSDLAPARAKISKGLLIEPHYLERSKVRWDKPSGSRHDHSSEINIDENNKIESIYSVKDANINQIDETNLEVNLNNYDSVIEANDLYELIGTNPNYDSTINYNTDDALEATAPFYNVDILVPNGETLLGEVDSFASQQIGMEKDSLANLGFGLYAVNGNAVVRKWDDVFGSQETTGSRKSVFLVKEEYTQKVSTQVSGWPVNGAQPGEPVVYEDVEVTKFRYKVSTLPFSGSITLGNNVVEVTALNGYLPTHYRFTNNLSEGLVRSFWKGSVQGVVNGVLTTPDGLPAVETFTTNPNILRVAKTGRGSGEPILEVD